MSAGLGKAIERLQKASEFWGALKHVRKDELKLVLDELYRLRKESLNTVLREATREPEHGVRVTTAGEFAAMWNLRGEEARQAILDRLMLSQDAASNCFLRDHDNLAAQLEIARHVSTVELNRLSQYVYEEIGKAPDMNLVMQMSGKASLVTAIEKALARIGIRKVQQPASWTIGYGHKDCAECEDCAEQAIGYAQAANTASEQVVRSVSGGHYGSAKRV